MQQRNNESSKKPKQPQPDRQLEAVRKAKLRMLMKAAGPAEPEEMPEEITNTPIIYRRK